MSSLQASSKQACGSVGAGPSSSSPAPVPPVTPVRMGYGKGVAGYYRMDEGRKIVFEGGEEQKEALQLLVGQKAAWVRDELGEQGKHFYFSGTSNMLGGPGPGYRPARGPAPAPLQGIAKHMRAPVETAAGYWEKQPGKKMAWQEPMFQDDTGCNLERFKPDNITQFVEQEPGMRRVMGRGGRLSKLTFPGCSKKSRPHELVGCLLYLLAPAMQLPPCGDSCEALPQDRELFQYIALATPAAPPPSAPSSSTAVAAPKRPCRICWPWDHKHVTTAPCLHNTLKQPECCYLYIYLGQAPAVEKQGSRHSSRRTQKQGPLQQEEEQQQQQHHEDGTEGAAEGGIVQAHEQLGEGFTTSKGKKEQVLVPVYVSAHRLMCWLMHGAPPSPKHEVAHECHHTWCLALAHIRWKTHKENMQESMERNKAEYPS